MSWSSGIDEFFVRWTLFYWLFDGIGLVCWSPVARSKDLLALGLAEVAVGLMGMCTTIVETQENIIWLAPLQIMLMLGCIGARILVIPEDKWAKQAAKLRTPCVWPLDTVPLVFGATALAVLILVSNAGFHYLDWYEHAVWSFIFGVAVSTISTPGAYGLGINRGIRWLLRMAGGSALVAGIIGLLGRLTDLL